MGTDFMRRLTESDRWYAGSEYDKWHAQGIRMWSWKDPWWIKGTVSNGI